MSDELVDIHPMQGQTKGSDFIQALLCSLQKQNLEPSKLVGIVTDGVPSMPGSENDLVSLLYKHMHELHLQTQYSIHCIILQQYLSQCS